MPKVEEKQFSGETSLNTIDAFDLMHFYHSSQIVLICTFNYLYECFYTTTAS